MGRGIVCQESIKQPGKRSRLWEPLDICNLFKKNTGTQSVECISLDLSKVGKLHLSSDAFIGMDKLRLLKFYSSYSGQVYVEDNKVHLSQGLEFLPDELRYLYWHRYPLKSLPSKFNPENLVEIVMCHSNVEYLWKRTQNLVNLRHINFSCSQHLLEPPDLTLAPNLETLHFDGCPFLTKFPEIFSWNIKHLSLAQTSIEEVPSAIECLHKLESLRLNDCTRLVILPRNIRKLTSLTILSLNGCSNITEFPEISRDLLYLHLDETAIEEVPSSVECLTKLKDLWLAKCTRLENVSSSIFKLKSLRDLRLSGCSKLEALPEISETMENLERLNLSGTAIKELPSSIEHLTQLLRLRLANCKNVASLPHSFFNLRSLEVLDLSGCSGIDKFLENLSVSILSGLCSLMELNLNDCDLLELPSALSCLSSLEHFFVNGNNFESLNLQPFSCLKSLGISYCKKLQSIQGFPSLFHLTDLHAHDCISLETLQTLTPVELTMEWASNHCYIFSNCFKLDEDAKRNILANAQLRIQVMATNAWRSASAKDYDEHWSESGASACICIPGSEIPGWFSYQNVGSSISIRLPQRWCSSKFLGFALCVVVAFDNYTDYNGFYVECKCNFETDDGDSNTIKCYLNGPNPQLKPIFLCFDHVFLFYTSGFYHTVVQRDDDDQWFSMYQSCHSASFDLSPVDFNRRPLLNCTVKKCGVCPLYLEEEHTGNVDEAELVEIGGDINSAEEKEDPNSLTLEDNGINSECNNEFCLAQGRVDKKRKI